MSQLGGGSGPPASAPTPPEAPPMAPPRPLPPGPWREREIECPEVKEWVIGDDEDEVVEIPVALTGSPDDSVVLQPTEYVLSEATLIRGDRSDPFGPSFSIEPTSSRLPTSQTHEERSLELTAPESAPLHIPIPITVQLRVVPTNKQGKAASKVGVPRSAREVILDLNVSRHLKPTSALTRRVPIEPGRDSDPVRFECVPVESGEASIAIRLYVDSGYLGDVTTTLTVDASAAGNLRTVPQSIYVGAEPMADATLEVEVDDDFKGLSIRLTGPGEIGHQSTVRVALGQSIYDRITALLVEIDKIARGAAGQNEDEDEALLLGLGSDLWAKLVPATFRALLKAHQSSIESLAIIGRNDPIPWELLAPTELRRNAFLSDVFEVSRWFMGAGQPKLDIGAGEACFVLPASAPPGAHAEIARLCALLQPGTQITTVAELSAVLAGNSFGCLHIAAHGVGAAIDPTTAYLQLDSKFRQAVLGANYNGRHAAQAPLVFINACGVSATAPQWVGATGWADRFVAAGAGAFIGSLWEVRDEPARDFAASFYDALKDGQTVGSAFAAARKKVNAVGDPTRLGYTLYGHRKARFLHG